ncbi:uncharacterized protein LOC122378999 [Amphibalanus amphitrite]|uniref:uncharacterized protein LOC122378999 n=1 Tax=Amphibalanus amphitrite TaxID=1232801 RepID=UPI001C928695|nr:uncharacterized protein LOC122378999 [Amphibalanus amphitrite]XP_043216734.1 uncharacterized protein LOC122378999 [Amphibalanus amphitrite]
MVLSREAQILLYVPNLIGYIRLACLLASWWCWAEQPGQMVLFYALQATLDGVDGWAARRLQQCSTFGAWLDVVLDNVGRTMLWSVLFDWGWLVACLEWLCFVCNSGAGGQWKAAIIADGPPLCRWVMADGFKTRWGVLAIGGLHVLPIWLVGMRRGLFASTSGPLGWLPAPLVVACLALLVVGRLLCALVELWCILAHVRAMLREDAAAAAK